MKLKQAVSNILLLSLVFVTANAQDEKGEIKKVAAQFVKGADINDGQLLEEVLESKSLQYVLIGGKMSTFTAKDYIQMVKDKKLGGKPRKITFRHAEFLGKSLAVVVLNAVSVYKISI